MDFVIFILDFLDSSNIENNVFLNVSFEISWMNLYKLIFYIDFLKNDFFLANVVIGSYFKTYHMWNIFVSFFVEDQFTTMVTC